MLRRLRVTGFCVMCVCVCARSAAASDVTWRVVLSSSDPGIFLPTLPTAHAVIGAGLADGGAGLLDFQLDPSAGALADGNWFENASGLAQYAQLGVGGAPGPGRSGSESTNVFRRLDYGDSIGQGVLTFGATANDSSAPAGDASYGIWQWDGTKNVEIARLGSDGALGPNLGSGATYTSFHNVSDTQEDFALRALQDRQVVFAGRIATPSHTLGTDGLSIYTPGQGNHACLLQGSTDPNFGPGIASGVFSGVGAGLTVSTRGEVYNYATVSPVSGSPPGWHGADGIWRFCDGAPKLAVLTGTTGSLGPGLPDNMAVFGGEGNGLQGAIAPSLPGSFYFTSGGLTNAAAGDATFLGLFHHDAALGRNVPILLEGNTDTFGPQIVGYVFHTATLPYKVVAAGKYAVLNTSISATSASSTDVEGLWRITADNAAQPVAITGDTGDYAPTAGRVWNGTFYKTAVFDNGDIVTLADTRNLSDSSIAISWWRLRIGAAPVEILKVGDLVEVPTANGIVNKAVVAIDPDNASGWPTAAGRDTWFSANGNILTGDLRIQGIVSTTVFVRGMAAQPDSIFANGFE